MANKTRTQRKKENDQRDYSRMPEKIPDSPENIARAFLTAPAKSEEDWDYLKETE